MYRRPDGTYAVDRDPRAVNRAPDDKDIIVHVMTGLPGSGKTKFARSIHPAVRFNLDDVRTMFGIGATMPWSDALESIAVKTLLHGVIGAVDAGHDVVIDNTHLGMKLPNRYRRALATRPVTFRVHDLTDIPASVCIDRDAARPNSVGSEVIARMASNRRALIDGKGWHLTDEWMNEYRAILRPIAPHTITRGLPLCVIFDIDGTLALHHGRGPFDFALCETDLLNLPVAQALWNYWDMEEERPRIILLSGRKSEYREHTERWLKDRQIPYDELHMRDEGDNRADFVVKSYLFERHIRGRYNVEMVYDDRQQVVELWRHVYQLTVAQVAPGNF